MQLSSSDIAGLEQFIASHPRLVVLTGAGVSVESGIPTYRDHSGRWLHSAPITEQDFLGSEAARQRYWSRSLLGWPPVRDARPNRAHLALAALERAGIVQLLITQNVDRLHQRAGSAEVVDLHGRLDEVRCIECDASVSREQIQQRLLRDIRGPLPAPSAKVSRPDGDADIDAAPLGISPPVCSECSGLLMPDVVFFGGSVPRARVERCRDAIEHADALLVVGSSLQVYSGFRFCRIAAAAAKPVVLVNPGATRADELAERHFRSLCGPLLAAVVEGLVG